ncbi:Retinoic acid induced 16-like protein-domain-containing protein [Chlamydoabsidia padenii]|nr:Retinoic acid induced 16-like protein-domain-containing protein [Chlamydoabsidia padenii]
MRLVCLRFFTQLVHHLPSPLLPAIHRPLQTLISQGDQQAVIRLIHTVVCHFKTTRAMMDLFFERGWCRGLGDKVWRCGLHGQVYSSPEKIQWNMFLMPRFDLFIQLMDAMNKPGDTGDIARDAILMTLESIATDPEYACYIIEYSGFCQIIADRLAYLFTTLPNNNDHHQHHVTPAIQYTKPSMITKNQLMITINADPRLRRRAYKKFSFDETMMMGYDGFFTHWDYLNKVARVADERLLTALLVQLTNRFWHPVVCTRLTSSSSSNMATLTMYFTEMVRRLIDPTLLQGFLEVFLGDDGNLRSMLIYRMASNDMDLSLATLQLFDTILATYHPFATYNLVLQHYMDDDNDDDDDDDDINKSDQVRWVVERVLSFLPSLEDDQEQRLYDDYLYDARERIQYRPPSSMISSLSSSSTTITTTKETGLFLQVIFDLFSRLLENSLEQNVMVTRIIQTLASDRRMMDKVIYSNNNKRRNVVDLLDQLTMEAFRRAQLIPQFDARLANAKQHHCVDPAEAIYQDIKSAFTFTDPPPSPTPSMETITTPTTMLIDGYIVLQEFCKELAAVCVIMDQTGF